MVAALIGAFTICDFPEKAAQKSRGFAIRFLTQKEADFIVARIEKDRKDVEPTPFSWAHYAKQAADLKVWAFATLFGLTTTVTYAIVSISCPSSLAPQVLT